MEAEALLLGIWRNVEDLEDALCLQELEVILTASREKEHRHNKFMGLLKGVDIDKGNQESAEAAFDRVQRRATARLSGASEDQLEHAEFGIEFEIEE